MQIRKLATQAQQHMKYVRAVWHEAHVIIVILKEIDREVHLTPVALLSDAKSTYGDVIRSESAAVSVHDA